jgi:hypothetical protein
MRINIGDSRIFFDIDGAKLRPGRTDGDCKAEGHPWPHSLYWSWPEVLNRYFDIGPLARSVRDITGTGWYRWPSHPREDCRTRRWADCW